MGCSNSTYQLQTSPIRMKNKIIKKQQPLIVVLFLIIVGAAVFTILIAPYLFKENYVWMMRLSLLLAFFIGAMREKEDFCIFLFIVSLSFSALNINVQKYLPGLAYFMPWIAPSDILLSLMLIFKFSKMSITKSKILFPASMNKAFLILIGMLLFSYLVVARKYFVYQSSGISSLLSVIKGYLVFIYFYNYLQTVRRYRVVLASCAFVVTVQFAFMLYQWLSGDVFTVIKFGYERLEDTRINEYGAARIAFGTFNFPSIAAGIVTMILPISIAFTTLKDVQTRVSIFCKYIIMILSPLCILLSGARVALVAMFFATPIILSITALRYKLKNARTMVAYFVLVVVCIGSVGMIRSPLSKHWQGRFSYENLIESSLEFRLLNYKIGKRAFEDHPIFGVGWGNGDKYAFKHLKSGEEELYTVGLHNGYVAIIVENGILGLVIYLFWYISLLRASFRNNRNYDQPYQYAFLGGIFAITIVQMLLVDMGGIFLRNQTEYMHFCLFLGFLRNYDEIVKSQE